MLPWGCTGTQGLYMPLTQGLRRAARPSEDVGEQGTVAQVALDALMGILRSLLVQGRIGALEPGVRVLDLPAAIHWHGA